MDGRSSVVAEKGIGGAAVADDDHQLAQLAHGQRHIAVQELHRAAAGDLLVLPDGHCVIEAGLSPGFPQEDGGHQGQLDDAGGKIMVLLPVSPGLAGLQILVVNAGLAGEGFDLL